MNSKSIVIMLWKRLFLPVMMFSSIFVASAQLLSFHLIPAKVLEILTELKIANAAGHSNIKLDEPSTGSSAVNNNDIARGQADIRDNKLTADGKKMQSEASVAASSYSATLAGFGGPILVIHAASNPFSLYSAEILLAEGLNQYATSDISAVSAEMLSSYDVVIVGNIPLTDAHVSMLSSWTNAGGTLIALKPDVKLAPLLGLVSAGGTLANKYLLVNTASGPGKGIVNQTMQYQGTAEYYTLNGATRLATLYSAANTATTYPAVTMRTVGEQGGTAVAFTYDLARSVVYTRQGNPAWSGQERDGQPGPIRSNDQFYPDWIDLNKVMIPQADEQQRLLANIITMQSRKPVPRFWYLPRGLKAAVVMTGDDHGNGGTKARFNQYLRLSSDNSAEAVADWRAIRGTSYIYPNTPITDAEAKSFEQQGFEIALHLSTNCANYTAASLERDLTDQLASFRSRYPSVAAPTTNRTHCIAWSDWNTQPQLEAPKGIRLDANYYYWPSPWVQDRPGMFTGSGIPMRFTDLNGGLIDCYQLTTQMTDESDQTFPYTIDQLLNKALGAEGYYGVFCANMHTDADVSTDSDAIIASAKSRNVPVISSKQLLTWLDGRNGSYFSGMSWNGSELNFSVSVASGARSLQGMLPLTETTGRLLSIKMNGSTVNFTTEIIKGIEYAFFPCSTGNYTATYDINAEPNKEPVVSLTAPADNAIYEAPASISITASASDVDGTVAKVDFYQGNILLSSDTNGGNGWSFAWSNVAAGTYSITAKATDNMGAVTTSAARTVKVTAVCPCTVFKPSDAPGGDLYFDNQGIQLGMKIRSTESGYVTGVRFYKQSGNSGTHIGQLYSSTGTLLAQATFVNETASGWQEVAFPSPVAITAGTTYIISYHSSAGYYSATNSYFSQSLETPPLRALANGEDGANGVYRYSNTAAFPNSAYQSTNYYVDVVFNRNAPPANAVPSVAISSPAAGATFIAPASVTISATATDSDGTVSKVEFYNGQTKLGEDLNGLDGWSYSWSNVAAGTYSITAKATDNGGAVGASEARAVTVSAVCPCTVFRSSDAPVGSLYNDNNGGIQLGMKFKSSINGYATAVRFYKQSGNTGTHIGQLYSNTGTLLAQATFINETTSGWQQVAFSSPVAISANTTYIISYHSSGGYYSASNPYFEQGVDTPPLRALANGESGPNGIYLVTSTPAFPTSNYLTANYWVDVVFNSSTTTNQSPSVAITSPANNATYTAPATIDIAANASDGDGTVSKVEFYNGTTKLGEDLTSPYSYSWTGVAAGTYSLTARATDNGNAVTTSAAVTVTVSGAANQSPSVAITSPANNATYTAPATIDIAANASDGDGTVSKVEFYNGTTRLGEDLTSPYSYSWTGVAAGTYSLTARATDNGNAVTTSAAVSVTVTSPPTTGTPTITSVSPTSGPVGTEVEITGTNLGEVTKVTFGPSTAQVKPNSNTSTALVAIVPSVNGKLPKKVNVTVTTPAGSVSASQKFTVTATALSTSSVSTLQSRELEDKEGVFAYPNPFSDKATISFSLLDGGEYTVSLYDAKGARVALLEQGILKSGERRSLEVDGTKLAKGLYLVRLQTSSGASTVRLVLDR
ncbi:DUF4082 domain-containing protein [Pontibacter pamirensis]|uniref:DUF4082 domain-containing protein n=1 Tax=Pontibacter pamirensis TaxID=2562824 RepID=UPI00192E50B0|nr:DUF4082 domain-containing protein [Pontibacter pamirensis]